MLDYDVIDKAWSSRDGDQTESMAESGYCQCDNEQASTGSNMAKDLAVIVTGNADAWLSPPYLVNKEESTRFWRESNNNMKQQQLQHKRATSLAHNMISGTIYFL